MPDHSEKLPAVFESTEVERLLGISSIRLNNFLERELYGLRPSIRSGRGRGKPRLFSQEDVFGIALAWWLFEAGLRSPVIQAVLDDLTGRKDASANIAAAKLANLPFDGGLLIQRQPRRADRRQQARWKAAMLPTSIAILQEQIRIFIPIGQLLATLRDEMQRIGG